MLGSSENSFSPKGVCFLLDLYHSRFSQECEASGIFGTYIWLCIIKLELIPVWILVHGHYKQMGAFWNHSFLGL